MCAWLKRFKLNGLLKKLKKYQHLREQGDKKALILEIQTLHQVAAFYKKNLLSKSISHAKLQMFEYYRAAASLNDAKAQYACALMCFDLGRFYETWYRSNYGREVHEHYMKEAFQQAFEFINAAEANNYLEAKRHKGLAYIYGWGVDKDTNRGFELILESIEMENAWGNATKIIEKLNLNSPEFFQALTKYQAKK